jgi:Tfp pilus assembly protein PilO
MNFPRGHPLVGHGIILVGLLAGIGVTRTVYLEPRAKEVRSLRAEEQGLTSRLSDIRAGLAEMKDWADAHPGQDLLTFHARRALPVRDMVPQFLRALVPVAERYGVSTELIQPAGAPVDESVTGASGQPVTYRKVELRFRVYAGYRNLGEYLREIESLDQLVVVRSVAIQYNAPTYPEIVADVAIWLYGTP